MTLPVSVIMPAYAHADYILSSLDSVLAQAVPPREVIVVDDGSPDDTAIRLAPLVKANRIRYLRQPNAGMATARNAGAALATSEYLYFLDDDDLLFPGALSWLVDELDRHPGAAMGCGESVLFSGEPPDAPVMTSETWLVDRTRFLLFNQVGSPGQVLIRRTAFEELGGFDVSIWGTDDWDLWLRLLDRYPARWARRPVVAYRVHRENASRNVARMYESSLRVARRHVGSLPLPRRTVVRRFTYRALRRYHVPRLEQLLWAACRRGEWRLAAAAARAWVLAWVADAGASFRLQAHLVGQGRWRLPPDEPLLRV
ncbi:MAG TPA: glycosyltransferase family A protein [Marisediminicola sp.]|jgi:glycosyltransferase involved in cell wall biosynthesis|nr:glycosyltransferase family A protein [Marisediminicola sp.]